MEEELEYEKIERFILGKMTPEEHADFEKAMESSPHLREKVALHKAIIGLEDEDDWIDFDGDSEILKKESALFRSEETLQFSEKLKEFRNNELHKKSLRRPWLNRSLIGAIAAILIAAIFVFYPKDPTMSSLYEEYHNWEELPSHTTKGDGANSIKELESLFRSENYNGVIILANSLNITASSPQAWLYIGVSHLELDQYQTAIQSFDHLIQSNSIDFHKGYWYKALTFLKQDDKEKCIEVLKIIVANPTYFSHENAKKLLKELH